MFPPSARILVCTLPLLAAGLVARPAVAPAATGVTLQWNTCANAASPIDRRLTMVIASHDTVPTDPAQTYLLMTVDFDFSNATVDGDPTPGLCTGANEPACWGVIQASYLDASNNEAPFTMLETEALWNSAGRTSCPGFCDPARPTTWGAIKSQYR